jgi:hypothetical protein
VPEAATSGVGGDGGKGCPRRWQIYRASTWERERECVWARGPGHGRALG